MFFLAHNRIQLNLRMSIRKKIFSSLCCRIIRLSAAVFRLGSGIYKCGGGIFNWFGSSISFRSGIYMSGCQRHFHFFHVCPWEMVTNKYTSSQSNAMLRTKSLWCIFLRANANLNGASKDMSVMRQSRGEGWTIIEGILRPPLRLLQRCGKCIYKNSLIRTILRFT